MIGCSWNPASTSTRVRMNCRHILLAAGPDCLRRWGCHKYRTAIEDMQLLKTALVMSCLALVGASKYAYSNPGTYDYKALDTVSTYMAVDTCPSESRCTVEVTITLPSRSDKAPVAIVSNGFMLETSQYTSYAERLASWGWAAVQWKVPESAISYVDHETRSKIVSAVLDWVGENHGDVLIADKDVYAVGHSAGAKSNVLAAEQDKRIASLFCIDPVDSPPPMHKASAENPSAIGSLSKLYADNQSIAHVGSGLGGHKEMGMACAPAGSNYEVFYNATLGATWAPTALDVGHMQFLDHDSIAGVACIKGPKSKEAGAKAVAHTMMVAWGQLNLYGHTDVVDQYIRGGWATDEEQAGIISNLYKGF